jgi:hypothetical protein
VLDLRNPGKFYVYPDPGVPTSKQTFFPFFGVGSSVRCTVHSSFSFVLAYFLVCFDDEGVDS